jgi:PAS domain S-box-containing protein
MRKPTDDTTTAPPAASGDDGWVARALDRVGVGLFVVDHPTSRILQANDAWARMIGAGSASEAVGMSLLEVYSDPDERAEIQARLLANPKFRETGRARLQVRRVRKDTREAIDMSVSLAATFDANGAIARMECVVEEVDGARVDERAFRLSEERFRVLFDANQAGMALTDLEGHVTRANPAFCAFTGRTARELVGHDLYALMDAPERPVPRAGSSGFALGERRFVRPEGGARWGLVTGSWLSDNGPPHTAVVVIQDVTDRKNMEQSLQRMAKLESLGLLAGGIAHDFNNVLAIVKASLAQASRHAELGTETRELLDDAGRAADRAADLARQLLTFAKGGTPSKRVASIAPPLRETADLCQRGSCARIDVAIDEDLARCEVDPGQINQVFQNLFVNAIQAMPDGGRVSVHARNADGPAGQSGPYVCVSVHDQGGGIAPENVDRIFDPYFTTKNTGNGLGLAIAHSIVARHGGLLTAENAKGRGSIFRVYLPATDKTADVAVSSPEPALQPRPNTRVLVMDDEDVLRTLMIQILADSGINAEGARNGAEAIEAYRRALEADRPFDAVILDVTIRGGMGGEATFAHLREIDPGVRAIVISGYAASRVMSEWRSRGFAGAVDKPFRPDTLVAAVVAATQQRR